MLESLRSGNHEAFSYIYLHFWDSLYLFIRNLIGSHEDAREITQEVFTALWIGRQRIDPDKGIKSFLYGIARNKIMDWFGHKKVESRFERLAAPTNTDEYAVDQAIIANESNLIARLAVGRMPKVRREVFEMFVWQGLSIEEIARRLKITRPTVSTHLYHARQELKKILSVIPLFW